MTRYIDVDSRITEIRKNYCAGCENYGGVRCRSCWVDDAIGLFEDAPTVDAVPVVHGYWINTPPYYAINGNYNKAQECSVCHSFFVSPGNTPYSNHPYCCECGAKMDGDKYE